MPGLNDCYVLAPERSGSLVLSMLDRFVPNRRPLYAPEDPSEVLGLALGAGIETILTHLEANSSQSYSMYFHNEGVSGPDYAGAMFNKDGSLVLMLSVEENGGAGAAERALQELKTFSGSKLGYWSWEEAPATTTHEFAESMRNKNQ